MVPVPVSTRTIFRISSRQRLVPASLSSARSPLSSSSSSAYATFPAKEGAESKKDAISQGHANDPENLHKKDAQSQALKGGKQTKKDGGSPMDAASGEKVQKGKTEGKGNPEGIGMADQVGSASGTSKKLENK